MDERGISRSAPEDKSDSDRRPGLGGSILKGAKSVVGATAAVAVVVGLHFGFPLLLVNFVPRLPDSVVGIFVYLVIALAVVFIPIGGTTLSLGLLDDKLGEGQNHSLEIWPWLFAIPSVVGYFVISTVTIWGIFLPRVNGVIPSELVPPLNLGTGIIIIMGLILLGTEISSGIISSPFSHSVREKRNEKELPDISQPIKKSNKIRHYHNEIATSDEFSYDWQAPPDLGFADVGGLDDVKSDIHRRVITPLRTENDAYERFRVTPPTGILLYGPPGTGKSYLARAIAGELGSPFVELSQADLTSMWINESPRMIRRLFEEAEMIGSSVIFIDEIDGLVATRDASGHREDSKLISELLARLGEEGTNYLIIAATNRPDQLDAAILRPGRFDEQFEIGLPEARDREEIFKVQLRQRNPSITDSEFRILGQQSEGLTAADIASVVERAALRAAERDAPHISFDDLSMSLGEAS